MRIIVTAGGSGGHIYPALAIVRKIMAKEKNTEVLYIGTHNRMEKDIIPDEGLKYIPLKIYGFSSRTPIRNIQNIYYIFKSYKKCLKIIKDFKPDIVIGVGGYVTYPVIKAAHKLGVKTFVHEQNAIPGKSNKALSKLTDVIAVSFPETKEYFKNNKVYVTGNPCGENALMIKSIKRSTYNLNDKDKLVVIVAGSQGSTSINSKMKEFLKTKNLDYQVLYITGKDFYEEFIKNEKFSNNIHVVPYVNNLSGLLKNTDLLISRAGASTISELIALKLPSILIPSPYVPNNHQYYNVLRLSEVGAAVLLEENKLNAKKLKEEIDNLLNNEANYQKMKASLNKIEVKNSSELIYKIIKDMVK